MLWGREPGSRASCPAPYLRWEGDRVDLLARSLEGSEWKGRVIFPKILRGGLAESQSAALIRRWDVVQVLRLVRVGRHWGARQFYGGCEAVSI